MKLQLAVLPALQCPVCAALWHLDQTDDVGPPCPSCGKRMDERDAAVMKRAAEYLRSHFQETP